MSVQYFDRYELYRSNGQVKEMPGISLEPRDNDKSEVYKKGETRLDKLSQKYYGNPYHGFLIMARNLEWGGLEFDIPDGEIIHIPFTFNDTLKRYQDKVLTHIKLYGK